MTLLHETTDTDEVQDRPLEAGAIVGAKYVIQRALGRGAFAWVYLANHVEIPSLRLAIKVLRTHVAFEPQVRQRFRAEAVLAAQLQSPHVVRVTDYGSPEGEAPYIVMEYVEGETLNERIATHGPVRETDVARLAIHIANALVEAHKAGIVHRDLKPSNIYLVDPQRGSDFTAKVLDFGIAKVLTGLSAAEMVAFRTASLSVNCTPRYAAPELLRGSPSAQSDIYALGITMIEALTGRPPYTSDNTFETAAQHLSDTPVPLGSASDSPLAPVIRKACAKDPDERYHSAKKMLADLLAQYDDTGRPRGREYQAAQSVVLRDETDERPSLRLTVSDTGPRVTAPPVTPQEAPGTIRRKVSDATMVVPGTMELPPPKLARPIVPLIALALVLTSAAVLVAFRFGSGDTEPDAVPTPTPTETIAHGTEPEPAVGQEAGAPPTEGAPPAAGFDGVAARSEATAIASAAAAPVVESAVSISERIAAAEAAAIAVEEERPVRRESRRERRDEPVAAVTEPTAEPAAVPAEPRTPPDTAAVEPEPEPVTPEREPELEPEPGENPFGGINVIGR